MEEKNLEKIIELRHELHAHPELSMNENWTKRRLMKFLAENTTLAIVDCGKWFYAARYIEGTPAIAFRAEMDALPILEEDFSDLKNNFKNFKLEYKSQNKNISHKCGHDGHCAVLCGLALELEKIKAKRSFYLIFQHAEETGQGGKECSEFLTERNIAEIYAFHNLSGWPEKSVITRHGLCQFASEGLVIKMTGEKSHASEPEKGKNPTFAIAELIIYIKNLLNRIIRMNKYKNKNFSDIVLCTPVNVNIGAKDFGISAGDGEISLTLRAGSIFNMKNFEGKICRKAKDLANIYGLKTDFAISDQFPETVSDAWCVEQVNNAASRAGLKILKMREPWRASEDFGWYMMRCPGAIFYIGNGENYPPLHTSCYDFNDNIIECAVSVFLELYKN